MAFFSIALDNLVAFPCENKIPSVSPLGTKSDRKHLVDKLDHVEEMEKEPVLYAIMLRRTLKRFYCP